MRQRIGRDDDADTYTLECECGFTSVGWDTKKVATRRGSQHANEHDANEPTPELAEFRRED